MHESYNKLFKEIAKATAVLAERVMETDAQENDTGKTAQIMRDDYNALYDKLMSNEDLTKREYARLLVGALIIARNLNDRITQIQKALSGYKTDIVPKLQRIVDECEDDESCRTLAEEIFQVKDLTSEET